MRPRRAWLTATGMRLLALDVAPGIALPSAVVLALGLNLFEIGRLSLGHDEAIAYYLAAGPWDQFARSVTHRESFGALHYLLLRLWTALGDGEVVLRSLSVVFAVLAVALTYRIGQVLFGRPVAVAAAVLLAVNAYLVQFAQEARAYTLATFAVTLATLLLIRVIERPSMGRWLAYAASAVLCVYAHLFAIFVLVAHLMALLAVGRHRVSLRWAGFSAAAVAVATVPIAANNLLFGPHRNFIPATTVNVVRGVLEQLAGGGTKPGSGGLSLLILDLALMLLAGLASIRALRMEGRGEAWRFSLVFGWALVPLVFSLAFAPVQPTFIGRYQIVVLPGLALVGGFALTSLRPRWLASLGLALAVLLAARGLLAWYVEPQKDDWRSAAQEVVGRAQAHDALVVFKEWNWRAVEYHATRAAGVGALPKRFVMPIQPRAAWYRVTDLANRYDRVWVLVSGKDRGLLPADLASLEQAMQARYRLTESRRYFGVEVRLYVRAPENAWEMRPPPG
jgi:mannosyltransferase